MKLPLRYRRYVLPVLAVLVFSVSLLIGFGKLIDESRESRAEVRELIFWSAAQTQAEYWRFVDALDRHFADPEGTALDEVLERLDILWSRIGLYGKGDVGRRLSAIEGAPETIAALSQALEEIEPGLIALKPRDRAAYRAIRARLAELEAPIFEMAQRTNLHEQGKTIEFRAKTARTYWTLGAFLIGILISGIALIVLLIREAGHARTSLVAASAAETRAQDVADHLSAVLNTAVTGIIIIDTHGTVRSFNPAAERLLGYRAEEVMSRNISMLIPGPHGDRHDDYIKHYIRTGEETVIGLTREGTALRRDGHRIPIEISIGEMESNGEHFFVGFLFDITERKKTEEARRASEQRFRDVAEVAGDWIWETGPDHRYCYFSDQMEKITGLRAADLYGKSRRDLVWVDGSDPKWQKHFSDLDARRPFRDFTFTINRPGIDSRHLRISGKPIFDSEGRFQGYRGTGTDITAQLDAEAEIGRKTVLLQATFDNMAEGISVIAADGKLAAFNARFVDLFDLPAGTARMGMPFEQIIHFNAGRGEYGPGELGELVRRQLALTEGEPRTVEHTRPNGTVIEMRSNPLPDGGCVITYADVTKRKEVEEEFRQAQKMEAIGRLTGGMAHEFNNLLTAIGGFAHLTKRWAHDPERVEEWCGDIISAADQAASLTSQLLSFSRKQILEPKVVSIGQVMEDSRALIRQVMEGDMSSTFSVTFEIADRHLHVKTDPGQLSQALLNLAINARDAMPGGGALSIATHQAELNDVAVTGFDSARPGLYAAISVSDTGSGIDEETKAQIFEPFFTTKEVGEGTGLGLAMVYGMVQQTGGVIAVDTEVGVGTTFTIYLPLADPAEAVEHEDFGDPALVSRGDETILVAEDELAVRQVARVSLEALGYTVLTAVDGPKAIEVFEKHGDAIDLLVTDLNMPGMNGRQLAHELVGKKPGLKVIFVTGFDPSEFAASGLRASDAPLLRKPFDPDELGHTVRRLLDASRDSSAA